MMYDFKFQSNLPETLQIKMERRLQIICEWICPKSNNAYGVYLL